MPLTGLIGFIIVANLDICAQLLPLKKKKETKHEMLWMRILPTDRSYIPKESWRERGCAEDVNYPLGCQYFPNFRSYFQRTSFQSVSPQFPRTDVGKFLGK